LNFGFTGDVTTPSLQNTLALNQVRLNEIKCASLTVALAVNYVILKVPVPDNTLACFIEPVIARELERV